MWGPKLMIIAMQRQLRTADLVPGRERTVCSKS